MIGDNLSKVGCNVGCISAVDSQGRTIWIVDAHRGTRGVPPPHPPSPTLDTAAIQIVRIRNQWLRRSPSSNRPVAASL